MAEENKPIGVDASGYELLTKAVRNLLNQFPGLYDYEFITFEELAKDTGIAFSADNGALVMTERVSITDHVKQTCQFPFYIVYRTGSTLESQKIEAQSFLDQIGKWLCGEEIIIDGNVHVLKAFPTLSGGRTITRITRMNSYGVEPDADGVQDWLLPVTVQYKHEYDKW